MKYTGYRLAASLWSLFGLTAMAQLEHKDVVKVPDSKVPYKQENIYVPDVAGYKTLKCDFHVHTIFSDGSVKPEERVHEGIIRGLDVMAITDHIEYRPNQDFIKADHNESYKRAKQIADHTNLILIPGAEITRSKPFGHVNALFITDANELDQKDPLAAVDKAIAQGGFIMWNHPGWPNDTTTLYPVHMQMIKDKKIHGVEIVNGFEYYPKAFNYCDTHNLAYMGNTDIHGVYTLTYRTDKQYGPMTLVFARERNSASVKEALLEQRSVVKFGDLLIGSEKNLTALAKACLAYEVKKVNQSDVDVKVTNKSSLTFELRVGSRIIPIPGLQSAEFKAPLNGTVDFDNLYITDNRRLSLQVAQL